MKILHLATQDMGGGGGGFDAAYRLHRNMRAAGVESVMAVLDKNSDDETVIGLADKMTISDKVRRITSSMHRRVQQRRFRPSPYFFVERPEFLPANRIAKHLPFRPDVIIAHWVSNFITVSTLRDLSRLTGAPVLWYLVDMGPLTGGCHYAFDCNGYKQQCGKCPQLGAGRGERDLSFRQRQSRYDTIHDMDITPVAGSSWLMDRLAESSIFGDKPGKTILLGMNTDVFRPKEQARAREQLGLPPERKIIFFGAQNINEERKGIRYLLEALRTLYAVLDCNLPLRESILIVTAGSTDNSSELTIPFEHRHIGFLRGDTSLAAGYQAADIFVNASVEDAGPMMINESLLCGTPVVSFDMGVAADLVHTDKTGYRARLRDSEDMADGLRRLLEMDDNANRAMREESRSIGMQLCHPEIQVKAFMKLCGLCVSRTHSNYEGA